MVPAVRAPGQSAPPNLGYLKVAQSMPGKYGSIEEGSAHQELCKSDFLQRLD